MQKNRIPLSESSPEIASQAHGWDPSKYSAGSDTKKNWKCKNNHVWEATIASRGKSGCPVCANKKIKIGFNDLETTHPEIAKQAFEWDPRTVTYGVGKKLKWQCNLGHIWEEKVFNRTGKGFNCPYCSGQKVLSGFNDLQSKFPDLAKEAVGWDPTIVTFGSGKKVKWKCKEGHTFISEITKRTSSHNPTSCPYCSGQKVLSGFNDLQSKFPDLAKEAVGWDPTTVTFGSGKKVKWKCKEGHTWVTAIGNRTKKLTGCPICSNRKIIRGINDLKTTHSEIASQADGWDPSKVSFGSSKKLKWTCEKGHKWTTTVASRRTTGCPSCATSGFDAYKASWIYFLIHPKWEMYQIGITNVPKERLKSHAKLGWDVIELLGPLDGHSAKELETSMLKFLRSQNAHLSPEFIAGKFDGYSESWTIDSFNISSLRQLINLTKKSDS